MKKLNLIRRLLSYSHEKQKPQRFGRYAAMLIMLLTLGVGQIWAGQGYNGESHVYLNVDGTTKYYKVSTESWGTGCSLPGTWGGVLSAQTFNKVLNIQIKGGAVGGWTENGGNISGTLYYKVTNNTTTPSSGWTSVGGINANYTSKNGNNCFRYKNDYSVNVTPTTPGTYYLHIKITDGDSNNRTSYVKIVVPSFTVAGTEAVLGSDWDETDTDNDMTFSSGTSYTLTKSNVELSASTNYECKVVLNHDWDEGSYPGSNKTFTVAANGHYDVTFTFNASTKAVDVSTTRCSYAITPSAKYTNDGSSYTTGTTGGTVTINSSSSATNVTEGSTYTIVATPATGYIVESVDVGSTNIYSNTSRATGTYNNSSQTASSAETVTVKFAKVKDITVYIYVGDKNTGDVTAASVEMNECTPYVGGTACSAQKVNVYTGSAPKFTLTSNWLTYTFTNVTKVTSITCARTGGNIFTGAITADKYIMYDGTSLTGQCIPYVASWSTAPANGAVGGNMTASVNTTGLTSPSVSWTSSNTDVATVNSSTGYIEYVATGTARITASISWSAGNDYCAGSTTKYEDISVTSGATVSATRTCPEYVAAGVAGQVSASLVFTGTSSGWKYRIKQGWGIGYETAWLDASGTSANWTMTGGMDAETRTYVAELYETEGASTPVSTSNFSVTGETAYNTTISAGPNGSVSPNGTVYANNSHVHPSITATPNEHYHFVNWTSSNAAASVASTTSATTTVTATAAGYTITANFAGDQYSITYKDQGDVTFSGTQSEAPTTHTYGTATTLKIPTKTGYAFGGWYTASDCASGAVGDANSASLGATAFTANITLYAKWTEVISDLTTSCNYDAGDPSYSAPTVSNSATTVGYTTTRTITAPAAGDGYTFVGWTLTNCTRTDGGGATANPITIRSNGDGAEVSVVAEYEEVLETEWVLKGGTAFGDNWVTEHEFEKKSGESTEDVAYYSTTLAVTPDGRQTTYNFKIVHKGSPDLYFGLDADGDEYWWLRSTTEKTLTDSKNIQIRADVAGTYTFKVDFSTPASPKLSVTYPTSYTLTYAIGDVKGNKNATSISSSPTTASGSYVVSGSTVTLTAPDEATGYEWKGWYGAANGSGAQLCSTKAYAVTVSANTTVYACYTEKSYSTNVVVSPASTGSISSPTPSDGKINVLHHTGTSVTASPNTNYVFDHWSWADGGLSILTSTTTSPATFKASSAGGTITAHFADQWAIGIFAGSPTWKGLPLKSGTVYEGSYELAKGDYSFKVVDRDGSYKYYTAGAVNVTRADNTKTADTEGGVNNNMTLKADVAGTYRFTFDTNDKTLEVGYPEAYAVSYSAVRLNGSGTAWSGAPSAETSASLAVTSGDMVLDGSTVTFTAEAANTGYTFRGWFNTSSPTIGTTTPLSSNEDADGNIYTYTTTVSDAAVTVYAIYTEDMHTVTVTADSHGTITTPASGDPRTVQAGISTSASIAASAVYGYYFKDWTVESGTASFGNKDAASTTVNATEDATILANFVSHWTIAGGNTDAADGEDAMGDWSTLANSIEHFEEISSGVWQGYVDIDLPANSTFKFKVRDLYDGSAWYGNTGTMTYGNHTDWSMTKGSSNCGITTAGKGSYRFTWNETNKTLTVGYPTSYTVSYGVKTYYNGGASSDASTTGGSITSVVDGDDIALTSGKYVVEDGSVTVVAAPEDGYEIAGWYSDAACTSAYTSGEGGVTISGEGNTTFTIADLGDDIEIYVKFAEKMTTVNFASEHGHVEISGATVTTKNVGVTTKYTLTPVADWGYYFAGWEKTAGTEYAITGLENNEDNTAPELSGNGNTVTSGQTLTAKFEALEKVYLYNYANGDRHERLWSITGDNHVYAYFAVQEDRTFPQAANTDDPYYIQQMQEVVGGGVGDYFTLYAYVPRAVTRNLNDGNDGNNGNDEHIAFSNHQFEKNWTFNSDEAIYWGSYRQILDMFVPKCNRYENKNGTKIYNGYWKQHDPKIGEEAGYYLKHRKNDTSNSYEDAKGEPIFKVISDNQIQCQLRIDDQNDAHNYYMIHSAGGVKYTTAEWPLDAEGPTITSSNWAGVGVTENMTTDSKFLIKQTSEGFYTLTISFTLDSMYLRVDYPVSVGDYRLEHSYTANAVAKTSHSGVFKKANDHGATDMYINTTDANSDNNIDGTLKLQKCTEINASGHPVWSAGTTVSGFTTTNFKDGNGVYSFRVEWDNEGKTDAQDVNSAFINNYSVIPYDGKFYIKTDYAIGGWVNWISNGMEKNTINFDENNPNTFDYYYTAWVSEGKKNVKCVIATPSNEAVSDTLWGDLTYLGYAEDGVTPSEFLPYEASVRFSYNSKTNEVKRAYLNGSNEGTADYLYLQGASESTSRILNKDTHAAFADNKVKFKDRGNWIYEIDIEAEEGARVKLVSDYYYSSTHHNQYLKGADGDWADATTAQILGGDDTDAAHLIRIVYDFKTNHLISAWLAGGEEGETRAINTNAMIIREHQEQARQITFANSSLKLTDVDTVYSVMKFNKWTINNRSKTGGHDLLPEEDRKSQYERDLFWISFPYDVKLSDVFGFGEYMKHWAIMYYDGRGRAKNGFWAESETNWKFIPASKRDTILHAFEGYVLALDLDMLLPSSKVWELVEDVYLYFPSNGPAGSIVQQDTVVHIDTIGYHCNIDWYHKKDGSGTTGLSASYDRRYRDSHWHCIGVPSFHDVSHSIVQNTGEGEDQPWLDVDGKDGVDMPNPDYMTLANWETSEIPYFYEWNMTDNKLYPKSNAANYTFKAMYSYMVQYANDHITWSAVTISPKPKSVVERRKARLADDHFSEFNLHLMRNEQSLDNTYVRLTDNEEATEGFEFGQDMCKEFQSSASSSVYTIVDEVEVAGNSLPLSDQTTIVPVGVKIASNGLYTFSMPEGTEGIGVILVDNIAGTRTNLGLTDYEVSLTAGKIDNRFWLEISPISQTPTGIDNAGAGVQDGVRKVVVDGIMYIVKEGVIYDAQGKRVQ